MKPHVRYFALFTLFLLGWHVVLAAPESQTGPEGHWEGSIQLPSTPLEIRADISRRPGGGWEGTIDIPVQGLRGFALGAVDVTGKTVAFNMPGVPGDPKFSGNLDGPANTLTGQFTQAGQSFPFRLERKARTAVAGETPVRGVPGKTLAGHWQGTLKPMPVIELRLALEITNQSDGSFSGVMISLDQGNARIPLTAVTEKDGVVHLETRSVGGAFDGTMNKEGSEISGKWKQGASTSPLVFKRLEKLPRLTRSQDPSKPYPYHEEEVTFRGGAAGVVLAGTLTSPTNAGPHPAVVLITGSGPQDRDEALMGHRPFLVLADHLTRRGITVLRCDDRGIGKSTGDFGKATDSDFVEDALAAVKWLRAKKDVGAIGLIGHSEGGIVAPRAALRSRDIAFIVLLAGVGVPMEQLLARQAEDISRVMGMGDGAIADQVKIQREMFKLLREEKDSDALHDKLLKVAQDQSSRLTEEQRTSLGISDDMIKIQIAAVRSPWFRELLEYDPRPILEKVACPVLAINGEKDLQVSARENLPAIEQCLRAGGNKNFKTVELPGLNHLFQSCQTGAVSEYSQIEETFNPAALHVISDWVLATARARGAKD